MANEEHLAILRQGVEVWNEWRQENPHIKPDLAGTELSGLDFNGINFCNVNLFEANLTKAGFIKATFHDANVSKALLTEANFAEARLWNANFYAANLTQAFLCEAIFCEANLCKANLSKSVMCGTILSGADLSEAILCKAELRGAILTRTNLSEVNLQQADISGANLSEAILYKACLEEANFSKTQVVGTNFTAANFTGACIEDWNINTATNLSNIICDYIYLRHKQQERRPSSGNFASGEFAKLFQKSLETVDLIFRNGIDWDAFAYSFKKVEVENQGAQLDVQSIEKKGDGVILVRVAVAPDADKAKIHNQFMQGYEFAAKALEGQYQARLEDKEKIINQLFSTINQQNKLLAQTGDKVSIYYQPNSQFAGGIVDANNVDVQQIGGSIQNNNTEDFPS